VLSTSGESAHFDVTVSNAHGHTLLVQGSVVRSLVDKGEAALFKTYTHAGLGWDKDIVLTVTPCSGDPDLYASDLVPRPSKANYKFAHAEVNHIESIRISARDEQLGDVLYVSVVGALSSSFTIEASDTAAQPPAIEHGEAGGGLVLSEPSASGVAISWAAATPPDGVASSELRYEVLLAEHSAEARVPVLFTQCGIDESASLIGNLTGADARRDGTLTSKLKRLQPSTTYQVNVRATLPTQARGQGGPPLLYRPMVFTTLERPGIGAGGVAAIVLASVLVCVLGTLACIIVRRRRQLASLSLLGNDEAIARADEAETFSALVASPLQAGAAGAADASLLPLFAQQAASPPVTAPLASVGEPATSGEAAAAPLTVTDVIAADPLAAVAPSEVEAMSAGPLGVSEAAMDSEDDDDGDGDGGGETDATQLVQGGAGSSDAAQAD